MTHRNVYTKLRLQNCINLPLLDESQLKEETDRCHVISCRTSRFFRISLRRPIIINVYTLFFSDTRWTTRQTISSGENIVSSITYLHKFNICRMSKKTEYIGCKLILHVCAAILYTMMKSRRINLECCKFDFM